MLSNITNKENYIRISKVHENGAKVQGKAWQLGCLFTELRDSLIRLILRCINYVDICISKVHENGAKVQGKAFQLGWTLVYFI